MLFDSILVAIGLVVGWFFLPSPQWVRNIIAALAAKFPFLAKFVRNDPTP
jgi:hypothetical protein